MGSYFCMSMKILFVSVAIMMVMIFSYSAIPQSFAVSDLSVTTQRDKYHIGDTVNISGSLYRAGEEELTLKMYDSDAKVVWTDKIPIGINDDKFDYSLVLSGPAWKTSGVYVIIAEIDDTIKSTSFKFSLEKRSEPLVTPPSINQTAMIDIDSLAQKITQQILSSPDFSQSPQPPQQLDTYQLARQITSQILSSPDFSQSPQLQSQLDTDSLAQKITQQILSSPDFSQSPQPPQQLDTYQLARQITSQILANPSISPPISNYTNEMSQENTNLANENLKLKADNRELINQNNILGESISKLQTTIDEQFQTIANITQELAEVRTVLKELFG